MQLTVFDGSEACPFCNTRIAENAAGRTPGAAQAGGARSALLLAALVGLGAADAGCGSSEETDPTPSEDVVNDTASDTETDSEVGEDTILPDVPPVDVYGLPPDVIDDDTPTEPPYGIPPMPDADDDTDIEDPIPAPEYGVPADDE